MWMCDQWRHDGVYGSPTESADDGQLHGCVALQGGSWHVVPPRRWGCTIASNVIGVDASVGAQHNKHEPFQFWTHPLKDVSPCVQELDVHRCAAGVNVAYRPTERTACLLGWLACMRVVGGSFESNSPPSRQQLLLIECVCSFTFRSLFSSRSDASEH